VIIGVPKETFPGERRVAIVPTVAPLLTPSGLDVLVETGAGEAAGFPDAAYQEIGARIAHSRAEVFASADVLVQVRGFGANPKAGHADLDLVRPGQLVIGFLEPMTAPEEAKLLAERGVIAFAMELIPRITRAQSMDALSSMATVAGYKAVLLAADMLPRMFPLLMTPAGVIHPARVFVIGAGVAGLQAIATARRLGAVVQAYDIRPAVKEQVQSLGAKFVELPLEAGQAEDSQGYARAMDEEFYRRQRELMARVIAGSDVVISTAGVPGKRAPVLITGEAIWGMAPGSVIVDLAAEWGGNCEYTRPGETVVIQEVTILGPVNISSAVPYHASQMYAKNITSFLLHLLKNGKLSLDLEDEITRETLVAQGGKVVHPRVRKILGFDSAAISELEET
jgi:NAD(P) transhydrogenase subunit alpha